MKNYAENWTKNEDDSEFNEEEYLSEGLIWYTIRPLATACSLLHKGSLSDGELYGWRPITHLDLQLPNVVLGISDSKDRENEGSEPPYVPIIADFGISFLSSEGHGCTLSGPPEDFIPTFDTRYPPVSLCFISLDLRTDCIRKGTNLPRMTSNLEKRRMFGALETLPTN